MSRLAFLAVVLGAGGAALGSSVVELTRHPLSPQWSMLVALTIAAGWARLRLRAVPASFSISDTFTIAAALLFGPAAGTVTVAVDALVMSLRLSRHPPLVRFLFNTTAPPLAMWIAAQFFFRMTRVGPLADQSATAGELVVPLALFALLYFVLNTGLVAAAVALERGAKVVSIWREHFAPLWLTYFGGASLAGFLVLMAVAEVIDLSALMLVLPLVVVLHLAYRAALDRANERVDHLTRIASYATALRSTADGVLIADNDRRITLLNAAAETLTGWTERAAAGRPIEEVFQTLDPALPSPRDPLAASEGTLREYRLLARGGGERPIEEMHASIRTDAGAVSGTIITFRDIAQRLAATRMKDEFLKTLSHELRTPATSTLGWVRMLRTGLITGADFERALGALERSARAQALLIEDLLDASRIVSGTMDLELRPTHLAPVVDAAAAHVAASAAAKGVTVTIAGTDALPAVPADPARLVQVFRHLLSNAVKFSGQGGSVRAGLQLDGDRIRFDVVDSGSGIDPAALPFIFDPFRQGDSSITRLHGGLGLGLAIVRHVVERHGGTVTAASEGRGRGSRFTVWLPLAASDGAAAGLPAAPSVAPDDGVEPRK